MEKEFRGEKFLFADSPQIKDLTDEIFSDNYKVFESKVEFKPGDVILDIGACEGVFSVLMKKMFPQARVIALEPVKRTFLKLLKNIELNKVDVEPYNVGVGRHTGKKTLFMGLHDYSGGSSAMLTYDPEKTEKVEVDILNLDDVFGSYNITRCRLMKIDIEGMEYEALYYSDVLDRVDFFTGEFHTNWRLDHLGRRMDGLANWVSNRTKVLTVEVCRMAE